MILPYLDAAKQGAGEWFSGARGKRIAGWTAVYTFVTMAGYILLDNRFSLREILRTSAPQWVAQGLLPALILTVLVSLPAFVVRATGGGRHEIFLTLFTVMLTAAVVFTLSGFLLRGPGFKLYAPWLMPCGYNPWDGL